MTGSGQDSGGTEAPWTAGVTRQALPPWLAPELDRLLERAAEGRLHHALLLTGQGGLGKRLLASVLARALVCRPEGDDGALAAAARPCEACRACRLTAAGSHPDVRTLTPGAELHRGEIRVDAVRELSDFLHLSAQRGGCRVAVILPCDRLNRAAANSLLKTLEEPPEGVFVILATSRIGAVPPTVRSRCAVRELPTPSTEEARRWLAERQGDGAERIRRALALAGGMPLQAEYILAQRGLERFDELVQQLHRVAAGGDPVKEAEAWQQAPEELADAVSAILAELIRQRHGDPGRGLLPGTLASQISGQQRVTALHQAYLRMQELRRDLSQPLNGRLAAEAIFLDLGRALAHPGGQ